jgi:hypothetical protein
MNDYLFNDDLNSIRIEKIEKYTNDIAESLYVVLKDVIVPTDSSLVDIQQRMLADEFVS